MAGMPPSGPLSDARNPDVNIGKIFIGGLAPATGNEDLKAFFQQFGAVKEATVMTTPDFNNPSVKRSRGFGFVVFQDPSSVEACVGVQGLLIDDKAVEVKRVEANMSKNAGGKPEPRKLFVGGLPPDCNESTVRDYFLKFDAGLVEASLRTKPDGTSKCFAYITFSSEEACKACLAKKSEHYIMGKWIDVKECVQQAKGGKGKGDKGGKGGKGYGAQSYGGAPSSFGYGGASGYGAPQASAYGAYGASAYGGYGASAAPAYGQPQAGYPAYDPNMYAAYGATPSMYGAYGAAPAAPPAYGARPY